MNCNRFSFGIKGWEALSNDFKNLETFAVHLTKIGMDEAILLTSGLGRDLKNLDLWENDINGEVGFFIVNSLLKNQQIIEVINLGNNELDSNSRLLIKKMLKDTNIQIELF